MLIKPLEMIEAGLAARRAIGQLSRGPATPRGKDVQSMLMQLMDNSNIRQLWRLAQALAKLRQGALRENDIKMKIDPRMLLKTQSCRSLCPIKRAILCPKIQENSELSAKFAGFL